MSEQKMSTEEKAEIWADMIGDDFLYMAKQFREILDEAPDTFSMVAKFTGVGLRKAYALPQIDRNFRVLNIERKRLYRIGWTKLQLVANHITEENCEELLALAETSTVRELTLLLRNEVPLAEHAAWCSISRPTNMRCSRLR